MAAADLSMAKEAVSSTHSVTEQNASLESLPTELILSISDILCTPEHDDIYPPLAYEDRSQPSFNGFLSFRSTSKRIYAQTTLAFAKQFEERLRKAKFSLTNDGLAAMSIIFGNPDFRNRIEHLFIAPAADSDIVQNPDAADRSVVQTFAKSWDSAGFDDETEAEDGPWLYRTAYRVLCTNFAKLRSVERLKTVDVGVAHRMVFQALSKTLGLDRVTCILRLRPLALDGSTGPESIPHLLASGLAMDMDDHDSQWRVNQVYAKNVVLADIITGVGDQLRELRLSGCRETGPCSGCRVMFTNYFCDPTFPNLKALRLSHIFIIQEDLIAFLQRHISHLEEFEAFRVHITGDWVHIFEALQQAENLKSICLAKLRQPKAPRPRVYKGSRLARDYDWDPRAVQSDEGMAHAWLDVLVERSRLFDPGINRLSGVKLAAYEGVSTSVGEVIPRERNRYWF